MTSIEGTLLDFKRLDLLATKDTALHRLDGRAKVLVVLVFIISVVSFGKYELSAMLPFFLFPVAMTSLAALPAGYIARKVALVIPFALVIGMFNPVFDREVLVQLGPVEISGGWISCASIVVRAILTVSAAFVLVSVTGFPVICRTLEQLGMPRVFVMQLLFLYRYLFVLTEEGVRVSRARELRSFGNRGRGMMSYGALAGHLLLRTFERAERIHSAMLGRGFTGQFHCLKTSRFGKREILFLLGWSACFAVFRFWNMSQFVGGVITGASP
jgi:cobalt/nickel transport system permease protein